MFLTDKGLAEKKEYIEKGYKLPEFDRNMVKENTLNNPEWIHFGAGNIFRAFQANLVQKLLSEGVINTGLLVAEGFDYEIIDKMYKPHDNLNILATLKADGSIEKTVIGSIVESFKLDRNNENEFNALKNIFSKPGLKMASFTITEKGYVVKDKSGNILDSVKSDIMAGPDEASGYIAKVTALLLHRFNNGAYPIAMVSMDNCSHNGDKLYDAILSIAEGWVKEGKASDEFIEYINDKSKVTFPWSMIDKITPRPDDKVLEILKSDDISDLKQIITSKNTYVASFVNAEETEYLVIEDVFPNGRIPLDKAGVIYTDRQTVDKTEKMKVCTCLNPLHTALAVFGCLLGYKTIHDEMDDDDLKNLVYYLGNKEGMKTVVDPKVLSPQAFLDAVLNLRLPNPFMPDTPQRIACDTSQKIPIRYGETIKAYRKSDELNAENLVLIPLVIAAWLRYLKGIDDKGNNFDLSPDPLLDELKTMKPEDILKRSDIFANDLFEDGLGNKIMKMYKEMCLKDGSVREVLHKYVYEVMA